MKQETRKELTNVIHEIMRTMYDYPQNEGPSFSGLFPFRSFGRTEASVDWKADCRRLMGAARLCKEAALAIEREAKDA